MTRTHPLDLAISHYESTKWKQPSEQNENGCGICFEKKGLCLISQGKGTHRMTSYAVPLILPGNGDSCSYPMICTFQCARSISRLDCLVLSDAFWEEGIMGCIHCQPICCLSKAISLFGMRCPVWCAMISNASLGLMEEGFLGCIDSVVMDRSQRPLSAWYTWSKCFHLLHHAWRVEQKRFNGTMDDAASKWPTLGKNYGFVGEDGWTISPRLGKIKSMDIVVDATPYYIAPDNFPSWA